MQQAELKILYEDNHIIAINKPAGALVQGDKTGDSPISDAVKLYIKEKYDKPGDVYLGVTHRIDRPVSGVLLYARTSKALTRLNEMFRTKEIQKTYWAVVQNKPPKDEDHLVHWLKKNEAKNMSYASLTETKGSLKCELDYKWIGSSDNYYLLEINPHTGRHHQIRVQLSTIGCPIKGDVKYGARRGNKDASIHLHARKIEFIHPVKLTPVSITAEVPQNDPVWISFEDNNK
jgi:23S rRNA pseudouridine1911/1915/1917 synthase